MHNFFPRPGIATRINRRAPPSIDYMQYVAATTPLLLMDVVLFPPRNTQTHFNLLTINHENTNLYHKQDEKTGNGAHAGGLNDKKKKGPSLTKRIIAVLRT